MKTTSIHLGILLLRLGIGVGMLTHGYGKFKKLDDV